MVKKVIDFFVFSSLFISICALMMVIQTDQLLHLTYDHRSYLAYVFLSTICSYNFHWYLTPDAIGENDRAYWTRHHKWLHIALFVIGLIGSAWFIIVFLRSWFWMGVPIGLTFLYSAPKIPYAPFRLLKRVAIGKTVFLAFVWMYVTTLLPIILSDEGVTIAGLLFCGSRFFLIYAICILFDYRDRENDKREGIKSMITYFNEDGINYLFYGSLAVFLFTTISLLLYRFPLLIIICLLIPGLIVLLLYKKAKRDFSDYLYYLVLDGLMMGSALLTVFIRF
jgi:4-hydroxybenzoate polyprenyltransferase